MPFGLPDSAHQPLRASADWWTLVGNLLTSKKMSRGVKLGYIEATTNKLAMLMLAMGSEEGTEQSEHVNN